jgi:hypothetical protein
MGFKSVGVECQRLASEGTNGPYEWVKRRVVCPEITNDRVNAWLTGDIFKDEGSAVPSMVSDAIVQHGLDDSPDKQELVKAVKDSAGTQYAGNCSFDWLSVHSSRLTTSAAAMETVCLTYPLIGIMT